MLYPDLWHWEGTEIVYDTCDDEDLLRHLSHFTLDNYAEWVGAAVMAILEPRLDGILFRFNQVDAFIRHGYRNPYREPGVPDWYFFWTMDHRMGELKRWCRAEGLLPPKDLPLGHKSYGGYGADTGLRVFG